MADGEAIPATVPVAVSPVPFHSREPRLLEVREGMTVRAALVEAVRAGILPVDDLRRVLPRTRVLVNGEELDRESALDTRLAANDIVNFEVAELGGGGGSKDIGQVLLTIAVIAVSAWVGSMVMFPTMVRAVASAAIMAGGNALGAALFAPEKGSSKVNDRYALQSASNQYRPWAPFPVALGEVVVAPDLVVKTFTRNVGDEVWIHGILGLHYGACEVDEEKIGDTLISSMGAGEVQLVKHLTPGPRTFSLYPNDVDQLDLTGELEATTSSATPIVRASSSEGERFDFHFFFAGGLYFQKDDGRVLLATVTLSVRYREVDEFGDPVGAGSWTNGPDWTVSSTSKEPLRITRGISLPMGRYEFEVQRSVKPDDNDKRRDRVVWSALQSIAYRKPVVDETLSLIEFAVKATSLNQGTLAPITCRIKPKFPTWTGTEWGPETPSSNPAAVARWLLTGPAPAKPLAPAEADVRLREWSTLCDQYGWRVGVYLQDEKTQSEALGLLERAGRASLFWDGTQIAASPWVEKPAPRQLFAGDNLRDHQWRIVYPEPVHALRVEFQNIDESGEADEVYVYADGYGETAGPGVQAATLVEALRLDGQMTPERAYKDGRWALASRLHQRRIDTWTAPVEHLVSGYGDRVRLAWSRVDGGFDARVRCRRWSGGLVSGLRLTRPVEMVPGESYALDLRLTSGVATSVPIINPAVTDPVVTREVFFADPRAEAAAPRAGDKVAFGVPTRISEDVELIGIEPGEDLTASLTGLRYVAPLLMAAETGPVPPLQTRLSRARAASPPPPRLLGVQADPSGVRVSFDMPPWSGSPLAGFSARWRPTPPAGLETSWLSLAALGATARTLVTPPPGALPVAVDDVEGRTLIDIEIRAFTEAGQSSPTPLLIEGVEVREDPFTPTNLTVTPATRTAPDGSSHGVLIVAADPLAAAVGVDMIVEVRRYPPIGDPDPWESAGLPLTAANPVGDILGLRAATTYGVRAAWRTAGGWPSGWTAEVTGTVPAGSNVAGDTAPVVPATVAAAPTLSIATAIAPDGTQVSRLAASWAAAADAVSYIVEIDDGVATWSEPSTEATLADRIVATGKTYRVRTKGVSRTGHLSAAWSPWSLSVAAGGDTTAPGPITVPTVTPLARRNVLTWTNPTAADFSHIILYRNTSGTSPASTGEAPYAPRVNGSVFPDTNVTAGVTYHYWSKTVDRTGNVGALTYHGAAAPFYIRIDKGDIASNDPDLVTQYGVSAGFLGQTDWATSPLPTSRLTYLDDAGNLSSLSRISTRNLSLLTGRTADNITYVSGGATVDSLKPAEAGANVTESRTAAAIAGQGPWATESTPTLKVFQPGQNVIYDGGLRLRGDRWEFYAGAAVVSDVDGNYVYWNPGAGYAGATAKTPNAPCTAGQSVTAQAEGACAAGNYMRVWFLNDALAVVGSSSSLQLPASWSSAKATITITAPAGATKVYVAFTSAAAAGPGRVRRVKLEVGSTATPFTDEATSGALYSTGGSLDSLKPDEIGSNKTETRTAAAIAGQGSLATKNTANFDTDVAEGSTYKKFLSTERTKLTGVEAGATVGGVFGTNLLEAGGGSLATLANFKTALGTAAAIAGQAPWATSNLPTTRLSHLDDSGNLSGLDRVTSRPLALLTGRTADNITYVSGGATVDSLKPGEAGANVTEIRTAAAIIGQGALATRNSALVSQVPSLAGQNLVPDPFLTDEAWHSANSSGSGRSFSTLAAATAAIGAPKVMSVNIAGFTGGQNSYYRSALVPVEGGKRYLHSVRYYLTSGFTGGLVAMVFWFKEDGSLASTSGTTSATVDYRTAATTSAVAGTLSGTVVAPADAVQAMLVPIRVYGSATLANNGTAYVGRHLFQRVAELGSVVFRETGAVLTDNDAVTLLGTAAAIAGQGSLATKNTANFDTDVAEGSTYKKFLSTERTKLTGVEAGATVGGVFGTNLLEAGGGSLATLANFKTALGTAAAIAGQGALATKSSVGEADLGTGAVSATKIADGAVSGAKLGTGAVDLASNKVTGKSLANVDGAANTKLGGIAAGATVGARAGTDLYRTDGSTVMSQAEVRTPEGTAAGIAGQGPLATAALTPAQVQGRYFGEYAGDAAANTAGLQDGDLYVDSSVFPKALKVKSAGVISEVDTSGMSTGLATQFDLTSTSFVDVATKALTNIQANSFVTLWFSLDVELSPGRTRKSGGTTGVNPSGTWQIVEVPTAGGSETVRMSGSWSAQRIGDGPSADWIDNFAIDGSGNVSDVSKRWRVANTGSVTWKLQMKLNGDETVLDFGATLLVQIQRNPAT